jgi:hypothetical protein
MKRIQFLSVAIGVMMSHGLAFLVMLGIVTSLAKSGLPGDLTWPPVMANDDGNRDKSGTSAAQIEQATSQAPQFTDVTNDGTFRTERGRFELPRPFRADRFSKPDVLL